MPEKIDPIDRKEISKEWLDQVIHSKIHPKIPGLLIHPISLATGATDVVYVVSIPRSIIPHQAADKKYYRRHNFESVAMEDYEINDVRNRRSEVTALIDIDVEIDSDMVVHLCISNVGTSVARDVSFDFSPPTRWLFGDVPSLITKGVKFFPPGKVYRFNWNMAPSFFGPDKGDESRRYVCMTTYRIGESDSFVTTAFPLDLEACRDTATEKSDVEKLPKKLREGLKTLKDEIQKTNAHLAHISPIGGATGLDLSHSTLLNLKALLHSGADLKKIPAKYASYEVFGEVLEIDFNLAHQIEHHFRFNSPARLDEIEGMTEEIRAKLDLYFYFTGHTDED